MLSHWRKECRRITLAFRSSVTEAKEGGHFSGSELKIAVLNDCLPDFCFLLLGFNCFYLTQVWLPVESPRIKPQQIEARLYLCYFCVTYACALHNNCEQDSVVVQEPGLRPEEPSSHLCSTMKLPGWPWANHSQLHLVHPVKLGGKVE